MALPETFREWDRYYVLVEGKPPYHPRALAGSYVYGMLNRIRSSRQLETACYNRLDVIWRMQGQHPDHSTIADCVTEPISQLADQAIDDFGGEVPAGDVTEETFALAVWHEGGEWRAEAAVDEFG